MTINKMLSILDDHPGVNSPEIELICCDHIEKWGDTALGLNTASLWKDLLSHTDLFIEDWMRCINVLDKTYQRLGKNLFSVKVGWDSSLVGEKVL